MKQPGRPKTVTKKMKKRVLSERDKGNTVAEISDILHFPSTTVYYILKEANRNRKLKGVAKKSEPTTVDLSSLPDNVLFKHSREFCF